MTRSVPSLCPAYQFHFHTGPLTFQETKLFLEALIFDARRKTSPPLCLNLNVVFRLIRDKTQTNLLAKGLPAGPGGASGQLVFYADDAEAWHKDGKKVILVRSETSPEDVHGMYASEAILTSRGGMTSHAALVARGWGKCCVVG